MNTWDDNEEWERFQEEMSREPNFHCCPGWKKLRSFYLDDEFYEVFGFGGDGGPIYNEDPPEILQQACFCLFCGERVIALKPEGPLLADQPFLRL